MIRLELMQEEQQILIEVLESFLSDLRLEITDTENMDFRETLKNQENVIKKILEALRQAEEGTEMPSGFL